MYQLKKRIGNIISTLLKFALFICFAFPFYWMVTTAFKSYQESIAFPPTLWPHNFSWQAFISVCQKIYSGFHGSCHITGLHQYSSCLWLCQI